ncbi:Arv1-domain-containing protein [Auriculariales sp. MPI-PUGE-AT-0066]|nr:Arv1-domain-containing protein [Auriculariales sp. MPI-PUGE-AT-0066]
MPVCITCTEFMPYLYTIYSSEDNLRLEICPRCRSFADVYVEHDMLIVVLDLVLLKAGAYRHLLFNRGSAPRRVGDSGKDDRSKPLPAYRQAVGPWRWKKTLELALPMIGVDSCRPLKHLCGPNKLHTSSSCTSEGALSLLRVVAGCIMETIAFHIGVTTACAAVLALAGFWQRTFRKQRISSETPISGVRQEFRLSHVPLTLIYSSATKLFLLAMLSIWHADKISAQPPTSTEDSWYATSWIALDDGTLDREWLVRNVLGGMAAGFGLRIALDTHPALTMMVILIGWSVKTAVAAVVGSWVAGGIDPSRQRAEMWLAYSIP